MGLNIIFVLVRFHVENITTQIKFISGSKVHVCQVNCIFVYVCIYIRDKRTCYLRGGPRSLLERAA